MQSPNPSRTLRLCNQAWNQATFVSGTDIVIRSAFAAQRAAAAQASASGTAASGQNEVWQNSYLIPVGMAIAAVGLWGFKSDPLWRSPEGARDFVQRAGSELGLRLRPLSPTSSIGKHVRLPSRTEIQRLERPDHLVTRNEEDTWAKHMVAGGVRVVLHAHQACQMGAEVCVNSWSTSVNALAAGCGTVGAAAGLLAVSRLYQPAHHHADPRSVSRERLQYEKSTRIGALVLTGGALIYSGATALAVGAGVAPWHYDQWGGAICVVSGGLAVAGGCLAALRACIPFSDRQPAPSPSPSSRESSIVELEEDSPV